MSKRVVIDITGQTFSKLTVLARAGTNKWGMALWRCRCACGKVVPAAAGAALRRGTKTSCGCAYEANQRGIGRFGAKGARVRSERMWAEL